jgi:iron complex outermembrane receptor protein
MTNLGAIRDRVQHCLGGSTLGRARGIAMSITTEGSKSGGFKTSWRTALYSTVCLVAAQLVIPAVSSAQSAAAPTGKAADQGRATTQGTSVGEIVVTARGRAENLQNVPLSVTALTADKLQAASITDLYQVALQTPSLVYNSNGAQSNASPVIRGLSDTSGGEATSQNVSIFLDGIYIKDPSAFDLAIGGISRIEVVEGPVSGLYGRNAFTGAINYVTANATQDLHYDLAVTGGTSGRAQVEAGVSGPIIPNLLAGRIDGTYSRFDGTYHDNVTGLNAGGYDRKDVMASLLFTPTPNITIKPVIYYGSDFFGPAPAVTYAQNCAFGTSDSYCGSFNSGANPLNVATPDNSEATGNTRRVLHFHTDAKFTGEWGSIDVLGGLNVIHSNNIADFASNDAGLTYGLYPANANNPFAGNPTVGVTQAKGFFGAQESEHDTSIEARYDSPRDKRVRISFGGFYLNQQSTLNNTFAIDGSNIPAGDALNFIAQPYVTTNGRYNRPINTNASTTLDASGFGGLDVDILPNLTLSGVVRYTQEKQKSHDFFTGPVSEATFDSVTSNESLTWKINPHLTAYVSAANGEKSGGFNGGATSAADATFQPETDWDYEAGFKSSLFDGRMRLNVAAFYTTLDDLQVIGPPSTPGAIALVVKNFGAVKDPGAEFTATYDFGDGFKVAGGLTYTHPRFDSSSLDFNDGAACALVPSCAASRLVTVAGNQAVRLDGLRPPFESDLVFNISPEYRHLLMHDDIYWFVRADYRYEDRQYTTVSNFAYYGPRNVFNIHIGIDSPRWSVTGYVLNLLNDQTPVTNQFNGQLNGFDAPPLGTFGVTWIPTSVLPDGRTFAVRFAYHY